MNKQEILSALQGGLIVSCQALPEEPLHSAFIMGRMATAAMQGGAAGIRANSVADILEIKKNISLPLIGIIKRIYKDNPVFITPTLREIEELADTGADIIAMDATTRPRPNGHALCNIVAQAKERWPHLLYMADCATFEEAQQAQDMGFDIVSSTLCGYTEYTKNAALPAVDLIRRMAQQLHTPVIAEGGIWTPEQLHDILNIKGVLAAVVGTAITRPMEITRRFVSAIKP